MEKEGTVLFLKKILNPEFPELTPQMDKLGNLLELYQNFCAAYMLKFPSVKTQQLAMRWWTS